MSITELERSLPALRLAAKGVVVVAVSSGNGSRLLLPDGKSIDLPPRAAGETGWAPPGRVGVENTSDSRIEYLVIQPLTGCQN